MEVDNRVLLELARKSRSMSSSNIDNILVNNTYYTRYAGVSKNAFIDCSSSTVIKMPRLDVYGRDFAGIERELRIYNNAPVHLQKMFAPILQYKYITIQKKKVLVLFVGRCTDIGLEDRCISDIYRQQFCKLSFTLSCTPNYDSIGGHFLYDYGEKDTIDFFNYLGDCNVNDLHDYNFGVYKNKIVCTDYSGVEWT